MPELHDEWLVKAKLMADICNSLCCGAPARKHTGGISRHGVEQHKCDHCYTQ